MTSNTDWFSGFAGSLVGAVITVGFAILLDGANSRENEKLQKELVCTEFSLNITLADNLIEPNLEVLKGESKSWINLARLESVATTHALATAAGSDLTQSRIQLLKAIASVREANYTADKVAFGKYSCREGCEYTKRLMVARSKLWTAHDALKCQGSMSNSDLKFLHMCELAKGKENCKVPLAKKSDS